MFYDLEELTVRQNPARVQQIEELTKYADLLEGGSAWVSQLTHIAANNTRKVMEQQMRDGRWPHELKNDLPRPDWLQPRSSDPDAPAVELKWEKPNAENLGWAPDAEYTIVRDPFRSTPQEVIDMDINWRDLRLAIRECKRILEETYDSPSLMTRPVPAHAIFSTTQADEVFDTSGMGRLDLFSPDIDQTQFSVTLNGKSYPTFTRASLAKDRLEKPDAPPPVPFEMRVGQEMILDIQMCDTAGQSAIFFDGMQVLFYYYY